MEDIYKTMANQNILNFYGIKLDLKIDYSETYDFQLDNNLDINQNKIYKNVIDLKTSLCNHTILTEDEFSINTQNDECIQYQH